MEQVKPPEVLPEQIRCPRCGRGPGKPCRDSLWGRPRLRFHPERISTAQLESFIYGPAWG